MIPLIGWFSSLVLLATLVNQVWEQWKSGESKGISKWLFLGQLTASIGFTLYSVLVRDWVFVVTNAALTVNAIVGTALFWYHRRRPARSLGDHREEVGVFPHADGVAGDQRSVPLRHARGDSNGSH